MAWYHFSKTANANANSDPTQNWAEGMNPGAINNSARALLAASAAYRDDVAGATVTTGTSAAYALATFSNFTSAAYMANQLIAFTPHLTNAAGPVTITVDSQANVPLRSAPGVELPAGTLIAGTPYCCTYNQTDNALYLQGFYGSPYLVPLGGMIDFIGSTSPNSNFIFPIGQAISRTTYASLFALTGTTYGAGDGSTTFNVIDMTGRVGAMKEASASRLTSTYFGGNSTVLGAVGGLEDATAPLPIHSHANTLSDPGHVHGVSGGVYGDVSLSYNFASGGGQWQSRRDYYQRRWYRNHHQQRQRGHGRRAQQRAANHHREQATSGDLIWAFFPTTFMTPPASRPLIRMPAFSIAS